MQSLADFSVVAGLGVIAGRGELPIKVLQSAQKRGVPCFVIGFQGQTPNTTLEKYPHLYLKLGQAEKLVQAFRQAGVSHVVLAGGVSRPSLADIRPDWRAARLLSRAAMHGLGDDGLLRLIAEELQREGFILQAPELWLDELPLIPVGVLSNIHPNQQAVQDIALGVRIAQELGRLDVGQAVAVQQGMVLAVEAIEGTDSLIARAGLLKRSGQGPVLVKMVKPQQDVRLDRPVVGKTTMQSLIEAGFVGLAVEANGVMAMDLPAMVELANTHAVFMQGVVRADAGE
ncbi:MAG: LpxI family protein [Alphaproteobacteria bacterium]